VTPSAALQGEKWAQHPQYKQLIIASLGSALKELTLPRKWWPFLRLDLGRSGLQFINSRVWCPAPLARKHRQRRRRALVFHPLDAPWFCHEVVHYLTAPNATKCENSRQMAQQGFTSAFLKVMITCLVSSRQQCRR
jgi:hypothetical protein